MTDRRRKTDQNERKGGRQTDAEKGSRIMVLWGEREREREEERVKRREWNHSEVQGAVIYCPWLIHSKCVEPRTARGEGERSDGGAAGRARRLLGLSACLLGACQQSHHPLPSALTDSSGPLHTHTDAHTCACI